MTTTKTRCMRTVVAVSPVPGSTTALELQLSCGHTIRRSSAEFAYSSSHHNAKPAAQCHRCHRDGKVIVPLLVALLFSGCAHIEATKAITATTYVVTSDGHTNRVVIGTNVTFHASGFLANSTLKNIGVDKNTKTTSALLQASGITNEPNTEAIAASAGAVGTILGVALKEALAK